MRRVPFLRGGLIVVGVLVVLFVLRIVGLDPHERRPGLWLTGERGPAPADWAFTDKYPTIYIQTRTDYLIPHSVTITCVAYHGQLYLTSVFREGSSFPQGKRWTANVVRDPRVRLKIGDRIYDETVALVTDQAERDAVLAAKARKYPDQRVAKTSSVYLFHVLPPADKGPSASLSVPDPAASS
jgi:hypothetical protein